MVDEDDPNKDKKLPYIKLIFCTSYPEGNITTNVFLNRESEEKPPMKQDVNTPDDAMSAIPYLSTNQYIISPVKTWAQLPKMKDPQYGLTFKIIQVESITLILMQVESIVL